MVHSWTAASIPHGWEEGWRGGPAMLSRYLICSLLGHTALTVCLQLQPVLIIRSEYSSPWAYDKKPEQGSIPHFKLGLPFFVCVCVVFALSLCNYSVLDSRRVAATRGTPETVKTVALYGKGGRFGCSLGAPPSEQARAGQAFDSSRGSWLPKTEVDIGRVLGGQAWEGL